MHPRAKNVDGVYIGESANRFITYHPFNSPAGTPHTHHYANAKAALLAGKHVLCEKPVTCNSAELRSLLAIAKEKKVFFMEALWTRFQPLVIELKKIAESGELGEPVVLHADLSGDFDIERERLSSFLLLDD